MKTTQDETTGVGPLVAQAQAAYEQKRTKECVTLIRQVLASDPDNLEAHSLQAAIQSDIERDLVDARALLKDSQKEAGGGQKYRKAAEIILLKILYLDPTHAEAKALLSNAKGSAEPQTPEATHARDRHPAPIEKPSRENDLMFTAAPVPLKQPAKKRSGFAGKMPIIVVAGLILAVGLVLFYGFAGKPATDVAESTSTSVPAPVVEPKSTVVTSSAPIVPPAPAPVPNDVKTSSVPAPPPVPVPATPAKGSLAVTSPTSAEIYMAGKLLGETPTTLQLNSGKQTLEYRHGNLKVTMTHDIKPNQTTTAFVNFEMDLQINARPWAQVFVEGTTRKALGQTPLGSVRVPLGSVLTFENPNFPSKTHKVTEKDSAIQIVFP